jgi:hypothetical protein
MAAFINNQCSGIAKPVETPRGYRFFFKFGVMIEKVK